MKTSCYSAKAPDIEEKIQAMMDYVYSEEGKNMDKALAYSIAGLILDGKRPSEIKTYLGLGSETFYYYMNQNFRARVKKHRKEYHERPEVKEKRVDYLREGSCPIACLWRSEEVSDDAPLSEFLAYGELLKRKRELGLKGSLRPALLNWTRMGILKEIDDIRTKRYAIDFSSPFFDQLNEQE
jgi:hypothetical protein